MRPRFGRSGSSTTQVPANGASANGASANGASAPGDRGPGGPLGGVASLTSDHPEIAVAAAFAGGVVLAMLARRIGR